MGVAGRVREQQEEVQAVAAEQQARTKEVQGQQAPPEQQALQGVLGHREVVSRATVTYNG